MGGFIHLRILQESQFGRLKVSSTLRVRLLVSLAACPPETPRWEPGPRARLDGGRGAGRGCVCSWSIQNTPQHSLRGSDRHLLTESRQHWDAGNVGFELSL